MKELDVLAGNLERLRKAHGGITQAELAERAGVSQAHISNIKRREKSPSIEIVGKIAKAFGLEAWQMLVDAPTCEDDPVAVRDLIANYIRSSPEGRQHILGVARALSLNLP